MSNKKNNEDLNIRSMRGTNAFNTMLMLEDGGFQKTDNEILKKVLSRTHNKVIIDKNIKQVSHPMLRKLI